MEGTQAAAEGLGGLPTLSGGDGGLSRRGVSVLRHEKPGGRGGVGVRRVQAEGDAEQRPDPGGGNLGEHKGMCRSQEPHLLAPTVCWALGWAL